MQIEFVSVEPKTDVDARLAECAVQVVTRLKRGHVRREEVGPRIVGALRREPGVVDVQFCVVKCSAYSVVSIFALSEIDGQCDGHPMSVLLGKD